jgi:predicted membrane GTPase involved in stress response
MSFSTDGNDTRYRLMPWHEKGELTAEEAMYYVNSDDHSEVPPEQLPDRRSIDEKENF